MYLQSNGQYQYSPYHYQYNYPYMWDSRPFSNQGSALMANSSITDMGQHTLADLKRAIEQKFRQNGFSNVVVTRSEVAGNKGGCRVSIIHLHRTGTQYWQVVMSSCPTINQARGMLNETLTILRSIVFFD
ncbi:MULTISPECIES: hypothetical protein [Brevibacillus]|nr:MULTISPECIES: hypothetical protein [Brevibacillus]RFB32516.1 hypothetical protein DZB91_16765 [Brevibacillus sp. VP]